MAPKVILTSLMREFLVRFPAATASRVRALTAKLRPLMSVR